MPDGALMTYAMLAWYGSDALDDVAHHMALDPAFEEDIDLTFRDREGTWWRPQRDGSWLSHSAAGWQRAIRPESLEGIAPLPMGIGGLHPRGRSEQPAEPPEEVSAPVAMERCVARVGRSYRSGEVVSTMAELFLSDRMLLTGDGRLWTVGARSGSWYAYGVDGWQRTTGPPEGPFTTGSDAEAMVQGAASPARRWADQGLRLPEPLTPDWLAPEPPESFVPLPLPPIDEPPPE